MNNFVVDENLFDKFVAEYYPEPDSFLKHGEHEAFNRMNTQIVINKLPVDILFIGDSITAGWETASYFSNYGRIINRGIGGEKLSELVNRFKQDCIDLKPKLCILAAGINDTYPLYQKMAGGNEITDEDKKSFLFEMDKNLRYAVKAAKENGIKIWIASVLPLGTSDFRSALIIEMNKLIQTVCNEEDLVYIDYHSKMTKPDGITLKDFTFGDDLHPHVKGYNVMYQVLNNLLEKEFNKNDR